MSQLLSINYPQAVAAPARVVKAQRPPSVIEQTKTTFKKTNRVAAILGALTGGFVPIATWSVAHFEVSQHHIMWVMVAGGLLYSSTTVYGWMRIMTGNRIKALAFILFLEPIMAISNLLVLSVAALVILVVINAIATACNLVMDTRANRKLAKEMVR